MSLLDYIKGQRKGKDANRIEKDAMKDSFLSEAIEGFDSIDDNHLARINKMQSLIAAKSKKTGQRRSIWQSAAASIVLLLGLGGYFLINGHKSDLHAQEVNSAGLIEIYVPEQFYVENIAIIAQTNTVLVRKHKPNINRFTIDEDIDPNISQSELEMLAGTLLAENSPIDIYVPNENNKEYKNATRQSANQPEPLLAQNSPMAAIAADIDESIIAEQIAMDSSNNLLAEIAVTEAPAVGYASSSVSNKIKKEEEDHFVKKNNSNKLASRMKGIQVDQAVPTVAASAPIPQPIIGYEKYDAYLISSLVRPTDEACKDVKGEVVVEFSIDEKGQPYQLNIKQSLCETCDKEAIRLILSGSKWTVTSQRVTVKIKF
ncbi:energy transducer TonB [Dysgonomonas sp. ZJ709]|uniref:energy transducer TonB n=1 Tax=Dysgonomonas sp. ZJ709 TaxID=2709797 RepID=UPI0013ED3E14|nr:energy transducer TonB [Dysgonomonas sp. ZJ709]